ncbi:MAG: GNAT family N-acetyltransferase [Actinomycetota bacterium]
MTYHVRAVTEDDIRDFATWRYDPPYDSYSITDAMDESIEYFSDPDIHCHVVIRADELVAFCTFGKDARVPGGTYDEAALDVGLGVRPSLTGSGNGKAIASAVMEYARSAFAHDRYRVTIAAPNERAQRTWNGVGFEPTDRFVSTVEVLGTREFVISESD